MSNLARIMGFIFVLFFSSNLVSAGVLPSGSCTLSAKCKLGSISCTTSGDPASEWNAGTCTGGPKYLACKGETVNPDGLVLKTSQHYICCTQNGEGVSTFSKDQAEKLCAGYQLNP